MNGLDKLKEKITSEAKTESEKILAEAEAEAQKILGGYKEKAEEEKRRILAEADKSAMIIVRSAESNANLDGKKKILKEKRDVMNEVFEKARAVAENLPDSQYFEIIYSLAEKCGNGEMLMSKNDKTRIPADFEEQIKIRSNGKITVSETFADIKNGFILKKDMIEENCSFDGITEAKLEELQDKTAKILFCKD